MKKLTPGLALLGLGGLVLYANYSAEAHAYKALSSIRGKRGRALSAYERGVR